ncbi:MAG: protease inhibitor I42 family protein, partial [Candidatus Omnitrophota bacterium]
ASSVTADKGSSSEAVSYIDDIDDSSQASAYSTDAAGLVKRITELEERVGEIEQEVYGFACGGSGDTDDLSESLSVEQLQQRIAALEARVATLESVVKDIEAVYSDILNEGVDKGTADDAAGYDSDEMAAAITDIKDRLSEINGEATEGAQDEGAVEEEITGTVVAQAQEGYVFISYKGEGNGQPFLLLGGAAQYSGEYQTSLYYDGQFMRLVEPVAQIAETLAGNGHNCVKIYLPPNNLTVSDAQTLGQFIQELYGYYNIKTYIVHFAGLYAGTEEEYLLNNSTEENLEKTADLVKEFAQWVKDLGPAVAAVQLGNENEYYVEGAGVYDFSSGEGDKINLSAGAYYSLMNALAGMYKQIDPAHLVFLGHGELVEEQIALLKDNLSNYDGIAVNSYCNWWEETHQAFEKVMSKEALEKHFAAQVQIAAALGKPLILSEFSETSYGGWGEAGQKEFAENITEILGKFMIGSDSVYPHIIVGLFWYQYFPEYWKDEIHPALSGMTLFEPVEEGWKAKEAFAGLSAWYKQINENLQRLINSALTGEESESDDNAQTAQKQDKTDAAAAVQETEKSVPVQETAENALDKNDSGKVIILEQGEELTVALYSNPTTGYDWDIYGVDENILQLEGTNLEFSDSDEDLLGGGGIKTFYFRAVGAGVTTLVLTYRRSWVKDEYTGIFYVTVFVP